MSKTMMTIAEFAKHVRDAHGEDATFTTVAELQDAGVDLVDEGGEEMSARDALGPVNYEIAAGPTWTLRFPDGRLADVVRAATREEALDVHLAEHDLLGARWRGTVTEVVVATWLELAATRPIPSDRGDALDMVDEAGFIVHDGRDYVECLDEDEGWAEVSS